LISCKFESKNTFELVGKDNGSLDELKVKLDNNFTYYGNLRIQTGDELSKRLKCV
jgi:hypothetical protein